MCTDKNTSQTSPFAMLGVGNKKPQQKKSQLRQLSHQKVSEMCLISDEDSAVFSHSS